MFDDVNDKLNIWTTLFMDVINEHIPLVKRRVKNKRLQVWMTQDILHQIGIRDKFKHVLNIIYLQV